MRMNSAAVYRPWLTICRIAPVSASRLRANAPITMKPRCASDEYLQVTLHRRHDGAVDNADRPEREQQGRQGDDCPREQGEVETDDAVSAELGHDPGEK